VGAADAASRARGTIAPRMSAIADRAVPSFRTGIGHIVTNGPGWDRNVQSKYRRLQAPANPISSIQISKFG